jgi:hypothetical protein
MPAACVNGLSIAYELPGEGEPVVLAPDELTAVMAPGLTIRGSRTDFRHDRRTTERLNELSPG